MYALRTASSLLRPTLGASRIAAPALTPRFVRLISDDVRAKIDAAVKQDPLVVFMKGTPDMPQCGFSRAVIQILQMQNVNPDKVATYNCLEDSELRSAIKEYSDWPTIPQVYLDGEFVGGCDIMFSLHQSGELEEMLRKAGLLDAPAPADA
ncbi:monothiol glutaredoxin grx5 [Malassezia cuniculi]|uniref:Monothiol glutaredoxin-5, mitochondrial n=1 Tax=Malassezia cuniculi TaxID=948313 RepID=A0AAF0EST1_9BASI|nr:monothiol glutaredoxin grx5 [Malassezia cuniculi]